MPENDIFKKNMAVLQRENPHLASKVRESKKHIGEYKVLKAKTGEPNVLVIRDLDHVMLYDNDSPFEYCKTYFESLNIKHAPIVVFLGLGLGYHLHMFMEAFGDLWGTKKIIVFEEDVAFFKLALKMVDLQNVITHPDIHLLVGDDPGVFSGLIRKKILAEEGMHSELRSTKIIPLPSHIMLSQAYYLKALHTTKMAFRQMMIMAGNDPTDSFVGMDNLLNNIKHIVSNPGINLLYDRFKGKPAVTVAAGPSLIKNMDMLKDISEKALIVCCDASFLPLINRGIRPHMVVSLERTDGTEYFFEDAPDFEDIYLAICPLVRPRAFESCKGDKIIVHRTFSHFDWLHQDKGALSIGPAVSNMAFKVAEALGCDPIIMIGQDLAFAEDGDTHVKEMVFGERDDYYHGDTLEVEGNDGIPVKTSRSWEIFRMHHEEDLDSFPGLCINATEGGAKVRGAKVMSFKETIEKYCTNEFSPVAIIEDAISNFHRDIDVRKELEEFKSRIGNTLKSMKSLIETLKELHGEARLLQKDMINPFMCEGSKIDKEVLLAFEVKVVDFMNSYLKDKNIYDIMLHTLQPHIMWFNNKFNFLPEIYSDEECLRSAQVLMMKEWLGVAGQLFVSTEDSLEKAGKLIAEDMRN